MVIVIGGAAGRIVNVIGGSAGQVVIVDMASRRYQFIGSNSLVINQPQDNWAWG